MLPLLDINNRKIRFTDERKNHLHENHPEMRNQEKNISETLLLPDLIVQSNIDLNVELFYKFFVHSPVGSKYLCVVVKSGNDDNFIITSYFTDSIKKGKLLWKKK
ncbi:MAG: hypothetical protein K8F60_17365 [Melioribacteraceae bacterium]|nr:hypothetical protein [Melioribacteraceae bacterium]